MEKTKLHILLAKTDHLATSFRSSIKDYYQFFKDKPGSFKGEKKTYIPKNGTVDIPSERGNKLIVTTVDEKLKWLKETNAEYINSLFAQEATNACGKAKAKLVVEGKSFGEYSSLELLRLKSLLENGELEQMYSMIPIRNDDEEWNITSEEMYSTRKVYEGKKGEGIKKSLMKEQYILVDPNIEKLKDAGTYTPQVAQRDTVIDLGDYTFQKFSGEWSARERAELLRRRTILISAVIQALKESNDIESVTSEMNADKLFDYLHYGKTN